MPKRIISISDVGGGAPTLEGTRLSCADVAHNLSGLGHHEFFETYPHLAIDDILVSLSYCAEQRCIGTVFAYCHSCRLRPDEPDGEAVWLLSATLRGELNSRS